MLSAFAGRHVVAFQRPAQWEAHLPSENKHVDGANEHIPRVFLHNQRSGHMQVISMTCTAMPTHAAIAQVFVCADKRTGKPQLHARIYFACTHKRGRGYRGRKHLQLHAPPVRSAIPAKSVAPMPKNTFEQPGPLVTFI
jgi:hypothetical protein